MKRRLTSMGRSGADLEKAGKPIGSMDMLIGAHALALGATLVTNNTKEFKTGKESEGGRLEFFAHFCVTAHLPVQCLKDFNICKILRSSAILFSPIKFRKK